MRYSGSVKIILAAYLAVVTAGLGLMAVGPWTDAEEVVPAISSPGSVQPGSFWLRSLMVWASPTLFFQPETGEEGHDHPLASHVLEGAGSGLQGLLGLTTGLQWAEPRSVMALALPSLFDYRGSVSAIAIKDPVVYLPREKYPPPPEGSAGPIDEGETGDIAPSPGEGGEGWPPDDKPLAIIYHTHTMESFLPELDLGSGATPEDAFTLNPDKSIVAVGETLAREMSSEHGIGVLHVLEYFDVDETGSRMQRLGAYTRAKPYIASLSDRYPQARLLIDLHRDSPRRDRTTLEMPEGDYARILLVVGTDDRLSHPDWKRNLAFAQELSDQMDRLKPGIMRGVEVSSHRYNQHLSPAALLVELGGVDNTLEEADRSARVLAQALSSALRLGRVPDLVPEAAAE